MLLCYFLVIPTESMHVKAFSCLSPVVGVKFIKVFQQLHMGDLDACSTCKIC